MKLQKNCSIVNNVIVNSPMFRDSHMRTQDVGEGKMSPKNTLLLHTKLFRALRNGSENTIKRAGGSASLHHVLPALSLYHELGQESDCPMCSQPTGDVNRWSRPEGHWQPEDGGNTHWGHSLETADPRFAWTTGEPRPVERSRLPKY